MRIANLNGRLVLVTDGGAVDVERASSGRFASDPQGIYDRWEEFTEWAAGAQGDGETIDSKRLGSPTPRPRQVFALGLNYADHAKEADLAIPDDLVTFTKFPSSITGPDGTVPLPEGNIDWEIELVVIIGREARRVSVEDAWSYVAGLSAGQDFSERVLQAVGPVPQFSLAKSHENFGPIGPVLVTIDEFKDPDDLEIGCSVNELEVQRSRTSELLFPVPNIISRLSEVVTLYPGDAIFTGTTAGVGLGRRPQWYLQKGDVVNSFIEGIGTMRHEFV